MGAEELPTRPGHDQRHEQTAAEPCFQSMTDVAQRMSDHFFVEDAVDRSTQPDPVAAPRLARRPFKQNLSALIIEEDAAVQIADEDALGELRHQRC